jgi:hypothetical protein
MEHRLNAMNEFRESLKDQSNLFLTKAEYTACKEKIDEDIRLLRESRAELHGKASQMQANIALAIAIIGILMSLYFGLR